MMTHGLGHSHRHVIVLGSTGSIGRQALEVLARLPHATLTGLAAGGNADLLREQAVSSGVHNVCLHDASAAAAISRDTPRLAVRSGDAGVLDLIATAAHDAATAGVPLIVLNGIVGAAGLRATIAALDSGATLALANKESLVAGGPFVLEAARRSGSLILPVDSEHSALFQCLHAGGDGTARGTVEELLLTGSGGPFRGLKLPELAGISPERALAHPTWAMGPKISIDSATLMNKGLEMIEAHRLFGVPYEQIVVLIDRRSVVHSMVRFADGAILAHLGVPDMRVPIGYALGYPDRPVLPMVRRLDLFGEGFAFERPDTRTFRCLELAQTAGQMAAEAEAVHHEGSAVASKGTHGRVSTVAAPIVLNAANEVAVESFLRGHIAFPAIAEIVEKCLTWLGEEAITMLDDVYACDREARKFAREAAGRPR